MIHRRTFLHAATGAVSAASSQVRGAARKAAGIDITAAPDAVALRSNDGVKELRRAGEHWRLDDVEVTVAAGAITIAAPKTGLEHVMLRWRGTLPAEARYLGDHWERSYGDLEWRTSVPNRVMPWYFLMATPEETLGFGVQTGAGAICFWQADPDGVSLWLDVRNGGGAVQLGERTLAAATVTMTRSAGSAFAGARALCRKMCNAPRLPAAPVYGGNNWYYTYGENFGAGEVLDDSGMMSELAGGASNRPFMVIDMGWGSEPEGAGPTSKTNSKFPDMADLTSRMKKLGARPGIWTRPLLTAEKLPEAWRLEGSASRIQAPLFVIDPSVPDALEHVRASMRTMRGWNFELIKHDYSTWDMLGRWGFEMGVMLTPPGWHFADRSRTTAEIVSALYAALRESAGDALLIGCNTIGHLGAGLFELQRIGDDTSGRDWERTRKMGVNTLAFRMAQHGTFFSADADCVPVTAAVPWNLTKQWLDLVARSGTPLFASMDPKSSGAEQRAAMKAAFALAAVPQPQAEALDWMTTTAPRRWRLGGREVRYDWSTGLGASPFAG